MKIHKPLLFVLFIVISFIIFMPFDTFYLWSRPIDYTGNTLAYHHKQLTQQGFSFFAKIYMSGLGHEYYEYLYIRRSMLGRVQYMGLERRYDSNIIDGATKYSPSRYNDDMGVRYSRALSDDFPESQKVIMHNIKNNKADIAENESFLLLSK